MSDTVGNADAMQPASILVVDAAALSRKGLTKFLAKHHTVFSADGSETARQLLEQKQPQCVVIDMERDANDALALLELVRNSNAPTLRNLPLIVLGPGDGDARQRALAAGAIAFLEKPFDSRELLELIREPPQSTEPPASTIAAPEALDTLTGLPREDYFYYRGEKEFAFARRYNKDLAVLIFEVDDLQRLVDAYGAALAKQVVKKLAKYLSAAIRGEDTVARLTGNRFGVLAPTCDEFGAKSIADRILSKVRRRVFNYGTGKVRFSVSAGLAAPRTSQCQSFADVTEVAYDRLDAAVTAGGDRAVFDGRSHQQARSAAPAERRKVTEEDLVDAAADTSVHTNVFESVGPSHDEVEAMLQDGAPSLDVVMWLLENGLDEELKPHYAKLLAQVMPLLESAGESMGGEVQALLKKLRSNLD